MAENGSTAKRYDTSMLRDFLDHLLCELRVAHSSYNPAEDGDLADLVRLNDKYRKKYNTTGLLEQSILENDVGSEAEFDAASSSFASMFSELRAAEIKHLDELQGLFNEALRCCGQTEKPVRSFSATEMLANA